MLEVYVERWSAPDGKVAYPWSAWDGGRRVTMGEAFDSAEAAEEAARAWCREALGREPDRVRRL